MSRRPSISIYDYPEDLNPFNDGDPTETAKTTTGTTNGSNKSIKEDTKQNSTKEPKQKFWTFGRSKKKQRSNSFSIKSTWNGLFGKRRESPEVEIRKPTIATVSSTYKRGTYNGYPATPARFSRDQQEFNEALGTLTRRRKYTMDNSSKYGSTLTVNGDPGRIYEGSPQDTTISILDNLTPKAPARRFGQVSPKPTEKIPPLDYNGKEESVTSNGNVDLDVGAPDRTPIPPKRGGPRASQRSLAPIAPNDEVSSRSADSSLRDENENVPEDYVFKKFSRDAIRKSNLSINSCVSVGSTVSAYGRKKRRAPPPPPCIREPLETANENEARTSPSRVDEESKTDELVESIDIARVTENIDEMTKRSRELDENYVPTCAARSNNGGDLRTDVVLVTTEAKSEATTEATSEATSEATTEVTTEATSKATSEERSACAESPAGTSDGAARTKARETSPELRKSSDDRSSREEEPGEASGGVATEDQPGDTSGDTSGETSDRKRNEESFIADGEEVEYRRKCDDSEAKLESSVEDGSFEYSPLRRRESSDDLSRSDSFSVKDEIEKIERQIKILEATKPREIGDREDTEAALEDLERTHTRMASLREQRKNFFRGMHDVENGGVKVELRELPREQNDIRLVRIEDPPIPNVGPTEPVRIIELHISEPIKRTSASPPTISHEHRDVNPIPKPRRHSNLDLLAGKETRTKVRHAKEEEKRGNSL